MLHTRKPMTDAELEAMQERLEKRRAICRRAMGEHYVGHPAQHVQRQEQEALVVEDKTDGLLAFVGETYGQYASRRASSCQATITTLAG